VSPVASRTLMSDAQRLGLLGRRGPVTGADLPAVEARGQGLMDNAMTVAGAVNPVGIRAFHGSPHTFDRFDMAKLGTGEGAQSYGHGLYFAGDEAVARSYRQKLALGANKFLIDGDPQIKALWDASAQALNGTGLEKKLYRLPAMADTLRGKSWEEAALLFEESARKAKKGTMWKSTLQGDADLARGLDKNGVVNPFSGSMYEVNLRTHPDRLLDWDKPLSGQSAGVRGALAGVTDLGSIKFGGDAYQALANQMADKKGRGNFAGASAALKEFNIDGIRYLDGGSRAAGQGSSNYVIWDDKIIDPVRRYLAALVGGGGAAAAGGKQAPSEEPTDYAQGGSVDSAPVYDPAVIAAIAASITEDNYA